ncbi:cytosolic enolase 3 [Cucumis melo var. makuwa]|uniref:phosphopyruvate hydratase n=1 Tax=Cucumis melo var. makuwa TaxID=1194695 RepID=A0A5A7SRL5_CUCMM|nr:cytosolic enolase 3 [Cucumis melo var. makuwa]
MEKKQLKEMSVQEYLDKYMLSRKIEEAVNAAVRAKTPDPVLFIVISPFPSLCVVFLGNVSNHMKKAIPSVITKIKARQILDSRGIPTVEVDLYTNKGVFHASVPSGDPAGMYEAVELRDGDKGTYLGNSVTKAVKNINEKISEALIGRDPTQQYEIDQAMKDLDTTEKKGELGANAILAVSIAYFQVPLYKHIADLAGKTNLILPVPAFTVLSGGKHAGNNLAIQEIMILPIGASKFEEALKMGSETFHHLKAVITEKHGAHDCNFGEDGGFAPNISRQDTGSNFFCFKEALDLVEEAINRGGYNERIKIAIDVAATNFCMGTKYDLDFKAPNKSVQNFKSGKDMIDMYKELCAGIYISCTTLSLYVFVTCFQQWAYFLYSFVLDYPIVSIEDPFDREDWDHTKHFSSLGICQVVGGDLLMSNKKRIERAIDEFTCNALLLKVNQIGTVTEAIEVVKLAKDAQWAVVASHRCGETDDTFLADLSVGLSTCQIKAGAPCRGERLAKYNQLLRIEEELGDQAIYAGEDWRAAC